MMKRSLQGVGLLALGVSLLMVSVSAAQRDQRDDKDQRGQSPTRQLTDQEFARMASQANLAEINFGMLAEKHAATKEVRDYGQRLVNDHKKANDKLNRILDRMRIPAAPRMGPQHEQLATRLAAMRGAAFDRAFEDQMVKDHERAIALFEQEAEHGRDRELRDYAKDTLPELREHLKLAQHLTGTHHGERTEKEKSK